MSLKTMIFPRGFRPFHAPLNLLFKHRNSPKLSSSFSRLRLAILRREIRFNSSTSKTVKYEPKKYRYPERILIYHAGTPRIVFVGCLKVSTILVFAFFAFVSFPAQLRNKDQPWWVPYAVLACGAIPFIVVWRSSSSFVTQVRLILPAYARQSRELLERYVRTLSQDAEVDVTVLTSLSLPRTTRRRLLDLGVTKNPPLSGGGKDPRNVAELDKRRRWRAGSSGGNFMIDRTSPGKIREGWVWDSLSERMGRQ